MTVWHPHDGQDKLSCFAKIAAIETLVPNIHEPDADLLALLQQCVPDQGIASMAEAQALLPRNFRVGKGDDNDCAEWLTDMARCNVDAAAACVSQLCWGANRIMHRPQHE